MTIDHIDLTGIDLNLLVALDALLEERSVTKAAVRLGLKQSATSAALARLRRLFGDELLTRSKDGLQMTPRAAALASPLRSTLRQVKGLVHREPTFDKASLSRVLRLALPDSLEILVVPHLLARLRSEAPGVRLLIRSFERLDVLHEIDADRIDMAMGVFDEGGQVHHKRRVLFSQGYLCLFNAVLLGIEAPISLDDYLRFAHVLTSLNETPTGVVDDALASLGLTRTVAVVTPRFAAVPHFVRDAPLVTTMIERLARKYADSLGLTASPVPVAVPPKSTALVWHASYDGDPVHTWLRDLVSASVHD